LFAEAATSSFEILEAQRKALHDAQDWDDDIDIAPETLYENGTSYEGLF